MEGTEYMAARESQGGTLRTEKANPYSAAENTEGGWWGVERAGQACQVRLNRWAHTTASFSEITTSGVADGRSWVRS